MFFTIVIFDLLLYTYVGDNMSNKKGSKKNDNNFPYSNELKKAKAEFIKMISDMSDMEFMLFSSAFADFVEDYYDEDFDDDDFVDMDYDELDDEDLLF